MSATIAVAGATGDLGGRVVAALTSRGASVIALVRVGVEAVKVAKLLQPNVAVVSVDLDDEAAVARAVKGAACVVSCLVGVRDIIIDTQSSLLKGCIAAGVPRFIPSDYSMDFTRLPPGSNRNLDTRRDFHVILDRSNIQWTSIITGVFASVLLYPHSPLLELAARKVPYVESADQPVDVTAIDDVAAYTAAAAFDSSAPRYLRIAGCSVSSHDLQSMAEEVYGESFELVNRGSLVKVAAAIAPMRESEGEAGTRQVYPMSQILQYAWCMFSGLGNGLPPLDNGRYPDVQWTSVRHILQKAKQAEVEYASRVGPGRP